MKASSQIPRPAGSLAAHTRRFVKNTMKFYEEAFLECGDIFAARIPGLGEWIYVCSPDLVEAMLEAPPEVLAGGEINVGSLSHVLGSGATSYLDGPAHQERKDVTLPYLDAQGSLRYVDEVREITERSLTRWPVGEPFPLVKPLQKIALEALMTVFFSAVGSAQRRQLAELWERFSFKGLRSPTVAHPTFQIDLGSWSPWGRVKKLQREVVDAFSREIEARLAAVEQPEEDDLVLGMARARLADGSRLPADVIRSEVFDMLFQGHELTGNSLTWTLGEVLAHPQVLARLREELGALVGDGEVRSSHLPKLKYLEAVLYEGLRYRPVTPYTAVRQVKQPFELGGHELPEGTVVAVCYPAQTVREDVFPNPETFDPERFLGQRPGPYEWNPFGGGSSECTGRGFAEVVMKVALATLVLKAELKLAQDEVRPVRSAYFYEPNEGLLVTLEKHL